MIQGNPGEKTNITCPKCNTKGAFTFPGEKSEIKTTSDSLKIFSSIFTLLVEIDRNNRFSTNQEDFDSFDCWKKIWLELFNCYKRGDN